MGEGIWPLEKQRSCLHKQLAERFVVTAHFCQLCTYTTEHQSSSAAVANPVGSKEGLHLAGAYFYLLAVRWMVILAIESSSTDFVMMLLRWEDSL